MKRNRIASVSVTCIIIAAMLISASSDAQAQRRGTRSEKLTDKGDRRSSEERAGDMHFFIGLGGGVLRPMNAITNAFTIGYQGKLLFQYNRIVKGLGVELDAGYVHLKDKDLSNSYIMLVPALVMPTYTFSFSIVDLQLKAGAGCSYVRSKITSTYLKKTQSAFDFTVGGGLGLGINFGGRFVIGLDVKYYYIFETLSVHSISGTLYFGVKF